MGQEMRQDRSVAAQGDYVEESVAKQAEAIVVTESANTAPTVDLSVWCDQDLGIIVARLQKSEETLDKLRGALAQLLRSEAGELEEAKADLDMMAEKLGNLLKGGVSRVAHQRVLEDNAQLRIQLSRLNREGQVGQLQAKCDELQWQLGCAQAELKAIKERGENPAYVPQPSEPPKFTVTDADYLKT